MSKINVKAIETTHNTLRILIHEVEAHSLLLLHTIMNSLLGEITEISNTLAMLMITTITTI